MVDTTECKVTDSDIVVINIYTGNFVDYRLSPIGEVILISSDGIDTEDNCIVTTWREIYKKNLVKEKEHDS